MVDPDDTPESAMTPEGHVHGLEREFGFLPSFSFNGAVIPSGQLMRVIGAGAKVTIDFAALNVFLRSDMFLAGGTPFKEVRRFCPPPTILQPVERSHDQAIDGYIDLFRQAVARRVTPNAIVALSGGRDSRHILLELHAQGQLPEYVVTIASDINNDWQVASELARAVGVRHEIRQLDTSIEGARHTVCATDFMSMQHAWLSGVARKRGPQAWWDGIAGDVLSAGHFLEEWNLRLFEERRLDELSERLVRGGPVPYFQDQSLFPRDEALLVMRAELERHVDAANPVGSFYFWNRTRVNIAACTFGMLRPAGQTTLAPFLDRDLWPFLASLPLRLVKDYKLHTEVIRIMYPEFAGIAYSRKHSPANGWYRHRAVSALGHIATSKPSRANLGAITRLLRSIVVPSRSPDVDWIINTWVYGDTLLRTLRRATQANADANL